MPQKPDISLAREKLDLAIEGLDAIRGTDTQNLLLLFAANATSRNLSEVNQILYGLMDLVADAERHRADAAYYKQMWQSVAKDLSAELAKTAPELTFNEKDIARSNKINAIKEYRARTGLGLKESKDKVEAFLASPEATDIPF